MSCYNHPGLGSVAVCSNCGKEICAACATGFNEKVVCRDCAEKLRKEAPLQAPSQAAEANGGQKPAEEVHASPAPEPSKETMPAIVPASVPTVPAVQPPEPPKVPERLAPAAAPAEKKQPLLSLILSAIVPGLGQLYNGQVKKGIMLLISWILLWIVVIVISSALMRPNSATWCCCLTIWIPLLVNVYAAYDAYTTTNKINKGESAKDWLS
jgi:hypothetical protein